MRANGQDFCDLLQMLDEDELTQVVMEVEALQDAPAHARSIAAMLLELRDDPLSAPLYRDEPYL